jgi:hypothetical protein
MSGVRRTDDRGGAAEPLSHLMEEGGATADALVTANERTEPLLGEEARAWAALRARRQNLRRWAWPSAIAGAAAMAALLVVGWLIWPRHQPGVDRPGVAASANAPTVAPEAPSPLRAGETVLAGDVRVRLSADGHGDLLAARDGGARIALQHGTLEIDARGRSDRGPARSAVRIGAGSLSIEGSGAHFTVTTRGDGAAPSITVAVHDGRAGISSPELALVWVYAGDVWTSPRPSAKPSPPARRRAAADAPSRRPALPSDAPDCLPLASSGATDAAITCLEEQSRRPGLAGELALVELARLRRDLKGDLAGAERALAEHARLFPRGSLAAEAGSARIELLLQLGRTSEALAHAERLSGGEASFWRGVCLTKLGRPDEARRALDDYLDQPGGTRRAEAMRRRQELGR